MAAAGGEAPTAGETSGDAAEAARRRPRKNSKDVSEVVDELALETKRTTLLDRIESQLKGERQHVSRLLVGFNCADDKKVQKALDQEFQTWRQQPGHEALSGLLIFASVVGLHLLEGPTELIFKALELMHSLSAEAKDDAGSAALRQEEKGDLLSGMRILHFTELHGVRVARSWTSLVHPGRAVGGAQTQLEEANCHELVFTCYKKLMVLCLKVGKLLDPDEDVDVAALQKNYKKAGDDLPTIDEVLVILGKTSFDYFFSYAEFSKVFVAPFQLVLHSELLWPMAPALSY